MDYIAAARKLIELKAALEHFPLNRHLNELARGEFFVLEYLSEREGAVNPKELSRGMAVSTARVAALLRHMEEKGLIVRTPDPRDSRQVLVSMTETGLARFEERFGETILRAAKIFEALGPEDSAEYLRIQARIVEIFSGGQDG